jgi:putative hydrolase of the HAD superfamily
MQINAVILDYGYTLSLVPSEEEFEALRMVSGMAAETFRKAYWHHRDSYDRGVLDGPAYWQGIAGDAGGSFSPIQIENLIAGDKQLWDHPNPVMLAWADLLSRRGVKMAILSNMARDMSTYLRQTAKWLEPFSYLCFSGELGIGKPNAAIYRACLEGLRVPASQALFIDDLAVNVVAAHGVGLHGVVFQTVEQLQRDLEPFGLAESLAEARSATG